MPKGAWGEEQEVARFQQEVVVSDFDSPPVRANQGSAPHALISLSPDTYQSPNGAGGSEEPYGGGLGMPSKYHHPRS